VDGGPLLVRDAVDEDANGLIELIGAVFGEYPGCVLDVDVATAFDRRGGRFWVGERDARVVACVGFAPADGGGVELKKLYVDRAQRGAGLGTRLVGLVEREAHGRGAGFIDLWSDTRFLDAHRLYASLGYERGPDTRELHDLSETVEFYFRKQLVR